MEEWSRRSWLVLALLSSPVMPASARPGMICGEIGHRELILIFVGLALSVFLSALDETIVAVSAISIVSEFEAFDLYSWVSVSYLVCLIAFQPLYGKLSDIFGRRPAILFAILVFFAGSTGCALASNIIVFLASRAIAGIAAGGLTGIAFIIVADLFPLEERPKYQSILMSGHGIACVLGPVLGGVFTKRLTWRWCFWINIPICLVTLVIIAAFLRIPRPEGSMREGLKKVDFAGSLTLVSAVGCLMIPVSLGGNYWAWASWPVICLFVAGVASLALFLAVEHSYAENPIIPLRLLKNVNLVRAWMTLFFYGMAFFTAMYYLPVWFEVVEAYSAEMTGVQLVPFLVGHISAGLFFAQFRQFATRLRFTTPLRVMVHVGCLIFILGAALRVTVINRSTPKIVELAILLLFGLGAGLTLQTSFVSAQAAVPSEDLAIANSLSVFFENLGGAIGLSVSATVNRVDLAKRFSRIPSSVVSADILSAIGRNPSLISRPGLLSDAARELVVQQFAGSLRLTFGVSVVFAMLAYVSVLALRHRVRGDSARP
ncbi:major facilitator superfamily domain-containing protein [Hygrophoropsis aurantiaca]|uniref:Major facilitator superfamily domain-containing protein n=1 Tax=Hygrophoropsis aurantiaca TaxID=72124 RepID=A0ACB8A2K4_9AGAM|nr:major facilitator superfamily domain-containing protein [Hygrophoropsis aurantiaca]